MLLIFYMIEIKPHLTLVGAGPGDPELFTLKGIKALKAADVVLYDALANDSLLEYCKEDVVKIFVGKRRGSCAFSQEEINHLIVENGLKYGHVVRLKGGDSFVFGRGYEEIEFVRKYNFGVSIVPGISSSIAVPEMQLIPLTARGLNESFWVTTGTTKSGELSKDIAIAAQSSATVVILMAMSKLEEITTIFSTFGKSTTPVAIIQHGTTPKENYLLGTVATIAPLARAKGIDNPAIIVVGDVVNLHPDFLSRNDSIHLFDIS
jgi:uroporphyrin-III C-methyltransferase